MSALPGVWANPSLRPKLPPLPPPKRRRLELDIDSTQVSGAQSAAFLANVAHPPWMENSSRVRDVIASQREHGLRPPKAPRFAHRPTPGFPPPPLPALGSPAAIARHAYMWDGQTTLAAHFGPDRHTMMINGRPMQAIRGMNHQSN